MYLRLDFDLEPIQTEELTNYVKAILPNELNEALFKDKDYLNKVIKECVKGQFKAILTEILQDKKIKDILRDRVLKSLDLKEVDK